MNALTLKTTKHCWKKPSKWKVISWYWIGTLSVKVPCSPEWSSDSTQSSSKCQLTFLSPQKIAFILFNCILGARYFLALEIKQPGLPPDKSLKPWRVSTCAWTQIHPPHLPSLKPRKDAATSAVLSRVPGSGQRETSPRELPFHSMAAIRWICTHSSNNLL